MDIFFDRIIPLLETSGLSDSELERNIGLPRSKIYDWKSGKTRSYVKYLPQIANYFHVSVDYLLGEDEPEKDNRPVTDAQLKFALWGNTDVIDDADLEDVRRYAAFIKARKEKK